MVNIHMVAIDEHHPLYTHGNRGDVAGCFIEKMSPP